MTKLKLPAQLLAEKKPSVKILIYGEPGVGKTELALTAPKPVLIDTDGGVYRLNAKLDGFNTPTMSVSSWQDVLDIFDEDLSHFESIVIDTAGKALDFLTAYIIKNNPKDGKKGGALSIQGYGTLKQEFTNFLNRVIALGKNIIFVAHAREDKDGEKTIKRPDMAGSSINVLMRDMDLVGYMKAGGENQRVIDFEPSENYYSKNSCQIPRELAIGNFANKKDKPVSNWIGYYTDRIKEVAETQVKYKELLGAYEPKIKQVTFETIEKVTQLIKDAPEIWDSKPQMKAIFSNTLKAQGIVYNKEKQQYEKA